MNYIKLIPALVLALMLTACGEDRTAEESAEEAMEKTEQAAEDVREGAEDAWEATREGAEEAGEEAEDSSLAERTREGASEALDKTKEGAKKAWSTTKEYSKEAWENVRESFIGDMTAEEKQAFDDCVAKLQKDEGLTKNQAQRGCWRMEKEGTMAEFMAGGAEEEGAGGY